MYVVCILFSVDANIGLCVGPWVTPSTLIIFVGLGVGWFVGCIVGLDVGRCDGLCEGVDDGVRVG